MMGFLKASSALAIIAAAVSISSVQANAADYGGDCCADLEERVAELEATSVRHGNRKVSLTISGSVTEALIYWNDGLESDVNVILPDSNGAGISLTGSGNVTSDVSVGYVMNIDVRNGDPGDADNKAGPNKLDGSLQFYNIASKIAVGDEFVYIDSKSAGRLSMGKRNDAYASARNFDGSILDLAAGLNMADDVTKKRTGLGWGTVLGGVGDKSGMLIRYDSPSLAGFTFTGTWGNDDTGTGNIGWKGSFSGTNVGVAVGYSDDTTSQAGNTRQLTVNGNISNDPTGLFLQGAYEEVMDTDKNAWQVKGGWGQNVNGLGKTTIWALYQKSNDFGIGTALPNGGKITDSAAHGFGIGLMQDLDAVGATLFTRYDIRSVDTLTLSSGTADILDLTTVTTGMTVRF
jgi:hypothetical protein